jgi:uncharacterized membrane protein YdbT with pleckstrin-like domain
MFSKADELMNPGEEMIESIHPSRFDSRHIKGTLIIPGLLALAVTAAVIGSVLDFVPFGSPMFFAAVYMLPVAAGLFYEVRRRFVIYHFTDSQIIEEYGILNKDINTIHYENITHTTLDQDFEERIFSVSDIEIDSAGEAGTEIVLNGVRNAAKYKNMIDEKTFNDNQQPQQHQGNNFNNNQETNSNQNPGNNFDDNGSSQQF